MGSLVPSTASYVLWIPGSGPPGAPIPPSPEPKGMEAPPAAPTAPLPWLDFETIPNLAPKQEKNWKKNLFFYTERKYTEKDNI